MSTEYSRRNTIKEFFSTHSEHWDSLYNPSDSSQNFTQFELLRRKDAVFSLISNIPEDALNTALDLGCGAGHYLAQLAGMGLECVGVDVSEEMLSITRKKLMAQSNTHATLINSDCTNAPLDDHSFDLIICIGLLEYLDQETEALQEMKRLLKSDGYAVVTFPNLYKLRNLLNPYYYLIRVWTYYFKGISLHPATDNDQTLNTSLDYNETTVTRYSLRQTKKIVRKAGFKIITVQPICFGPFSLWKRSHCSLNTSIKTSDFIERLLQYRPFGFLKYLSNRWVMLIKPEAPNDHTLHEKRGVS